MTVAVDEQGSVAKLRLSVFVVGLGLLIGVSILIPFFEPPFGGHYYLQWLAGVAAILGIMVWRRGEYGRLAIVSKMVTVASAVLLVATAHRCRVGIGYPDLHA